jgi:hypothetical protein
MTTIESLQHVSTLLIAIASLIGTLWGITVAVAAWFSKRQTKEIVDATTSSMQRWCQEQMLEAVSKLNPDSYYTLDLHFSNGLSISAPMVPDVPLFVSENIQIKVISHTADKTMLLLSCKGFGIFLPHFHADTCETIEIREGYLTSRETGTIYREGDQWIIPANEMHSAIMEDCVAVITHRPPLPTAKKRPVDLTNVALIFPKQ